jgi:hypothetical protein
VASGAVLPSIVTVPAIAEACGEALRRPGQVFVFDDGWFDVTQQSSSPAAVAATVAAAGGGYFAIKVQLALDAATMRPVEPSGPLVIYDESRGRRWIVRDTERWAASNAAVAAAVRGCPGGRRVKAYFRALQFPDGGLEIVMPATVAQRW